MAQSFDGFPRDTFSWFSGLAADNSKPYFDANRAVYDRSVKGALSEMLEELADTLGGQVKLFRQNRDLRFSRHREPYKTTTYGVIRERPDSLAPLYAQLSSAGLFAGTGYYQLAADQLSRFREAVADDRTGTALEQAVALADAGNVETFGEALKSAPRGYPRDHPRAQLLRHRSLIAGRRVSPGRKGIEREVALEHARATWSACAALNAWLDAHVGASEISPPRR